MTASDHIKRADGWVIDTLFQPVADRLPESIPALQLGMSCQLGSLLFYGLSLLIPILVMGATVGDVIDTILVWLMGMAFFLGLQKSRHVVRANALNPLRPLLMSMRVISIIFLVYVAYRGMSVAAPYWLPAQLTTLSQLLFVIGLYLVACQPRPPRQRVSMRQGNVIEGLWPTGKIRSSQGL